MKVLTKNVQDFYGVSSYSSLKNANSKTGKKDCDVLSFLDSIENVASPEKEEKFIEFCLKQTIHSEFNLKVAA